MIDVPLLPTKLNPRRRPVATRVTGYVPHPKFQKNMGWKGWACMGTTAGMLSVALSEALIKKDVEIYLNSDKLVNICNKRKQSQFARLARLLRVGGVRGGVCFLTFMGVFNYLNVKRGVVDVHNFAAAGIVSGGAFDLMAPLLATGIRQQRVRSPMVFSLYAGVVSYPIGWVSLKLLEKQIVYVDGLAKQIKGRESKQCDDSDEAHIKDEEAV